MGLWEIMMAIAMTIVGAILGWIITIHTTKSKKPLWFCRVNPLFREGIATIQDLCITYKSNAVRNLSAIYFAFWNDGKEPITRDAIAESLRLTTTGKIYDAQVIHATTSSNDLTVVISEDNSAAELDFRYLDYKQGAVIQLFSDASDISEIQVKGAIMGCKKFKTTFTYREKSKVEPFAGVISSITSILVAAIGTVTVFFTQNSLLADTKKLQLSLLIALISGLVIAVIAFLVYRYSRDTRYRMPKEFRKYF